MTDIKKDLPDSEERIAEFEQELAKVLDLDPCRKESRDPDMPDGWRVRPEDCLHLLIDVQERLAPLIQDRGVVEQNVRIMVEACQALAIPTLVTEQYPKGLGPTVPELKAVCDAAGAKYYAKTRFTAAIPEVLAEIEESGRQSIILTGMEAHICVWQTAMDLLALGYQVYLPEDAIGSRQSKHKQRALDNLILYGAEVVPVEGLLFELIQDSKHSAFKTISNLIK
ncbi:MAG: isochorismatase family protein [Eubacteriales bacterium]|nr:isochorismatase family protein [Eubacteriales bacterium]